MPSYCATLFLGDGSRVTKKAESGLEEMLGSKLEYSGKNYPSWKDMFSLFDSKLIWLERLTIENYFDFESSQSNFVETEFVFFFFFLSNSRLNGKAKIVSCNY